MKEVPSTDNSPKYHLPHHAGVKPEITTKLRVVFNASSPSANGTSLNNILHAGAFLDLTIHIRKWRYFQNVFSADIKKKGIVRSGSTRNIPFSKNSFPK